MLRAVRRPTYQNETTGSGAIFFIFFVVTKLLQVIHAVAPAYDQYRDKDECIKDLEKTFLSCFQKADELGCVSLAIPPLSAGRWVQQYALVSSLIILILILGIKYIIL